MKIEIEITEQELKDLKAVRNYFGEHDKTLFEHKAYAVVDSLVKKLNIPAVISSVCSCDNVHGEIETKTNYCWYCLKTIKEQTDL